MREAVENMQVVVRYVNTHENLADFFTKYLPPKQFFSLRNNITNINNSDEKRPTTSNSDYKPHGHVDDFPGSHDEIAYANYCHPCDMPYVD